ncbi:MAG TPA: D-alanyl-D-alanine carboxypeptidase/D-alanyl-D-alanine-endopeptidase [Gammaproteobacteria bacterium]|jgi:D-alanyl-D-alanine carboxypeptidase/D-alanyl-D-alanine-endopeptidase (penicillin-binding protein 4)|nr:D-alanyl-D-alanine carboxypeptidase/D-alanyl-D-alanine-endopeptidase [Gammaproteobacteria bacterium]
MNHKIMRIMAALAFLYAMPAQAQHHAHHTTKAHHHIYARRGVSAGVKVPIEPTFSIPQLSNQLSAIINTTPNTQIGVYVKSMASDRLLFTHHIDQSFTPASTLKILTAEAALLYLKPTYRFSTQLLTDAKTVNNGVLQGNLYIVLSGDPTLSYDNIVELLFSLKAHQIQAISGNVYIDNTAYDQRFYGPGWKESDKKNCYAAPISAGIINHNCMPISVTSSPQRKQFQTKSTGTTIPQTPYHRCILHVSQHLNGIDIDNCTLRKSIESISYVVTDVPEYNRTLFKNALGQLATRVYGVITFGSAPQNLSLVGTHDSAPLNELIHQMLKKSDNIIAGALFKKMGQLYAHQPGSWENGSAAVSRILSTYASLNPQGMQMLDGSGLSENNLTTPAQMMSVLAFAYHNAATNQDFISALPIAGVDGTLKNRMGNIARKVRAKTGTMPLSGVVSLAGYVLNAKNEPLAFVIMVNGTRGMGWRYKALEDQLVTALTKSQY